MNNTERNINVIRGKLINFSLITIMFLTIPAFIFSIIASARYGFHPSYILHYSEFLITLLLVLFRKKIPNIIKAHIIATFFIIAGFFGNLLFSFSGGHYICLIGIMLITLLYGKKSGIVYSLIALAGYVLLEMFYSYGIIERNLDFNKFNSNINIWITTFFTLMFIAIIIVSSVSYFYIYFIRLVTDLENKNSEMNDLNKRHEIALNKIEESEIKYRTVFEAIEEGIIITDQCGNFIDLNSASEQLLEIRKEDQLNINLIKEDWNLVRPNLTPMPLDEFPSIRVMKEGKPVSRIEMGYVKNGEIKWLMASAFPLKLQGYGVLITYYDITEIKNKEEERNLFNSNFEAFLDHITDYIFFKDINSRIIFCSQSLASITGHKNWRDIIGKQDIEIFPHDVANIYIKEDKTIIEEGIPLLGQVDLFYDENGDKGYVQTNKWPLFGARKNLLGVLGISRNITEQVREKEELEKREEKISLLLNSTAEGIYGIDLNGICTFINKSGIYQLGYDSADDFVGKNMHDLIHHSYKYNSPMPYSKCKIAIALNEKRGVHCDDEVFWKKDGTYIPVNYYSYPQIKDGHSIGGVITFTDITERKIIEERLLQYTKDLNILNSDKDKFIKILAHDLKNPFTSLIGFSDFILDNIDNLDIETIKSQVEIISQTSHNTFDMLEEMLIWLNSHSGKLKMNPTDFSFKEVCENIIPVLKVNANSKDIEITCSDIDNISIFADKNMIITIIRNLISNAIKFTYPNGKIDVSIEKNDKEIMISIADNGVGISEDALKKIWINPYNSKTLGTSGEKGTGLGLSICKELVEKHKGKIWVESKEGLGSNFKFTIPLKKED